MKIILKIFTAVSLGALLLCFGFRSYSYELPRYTVSSQDGIYSAYEGEGQSGTCVASSSDLTELLAALGESHLYFRDCYAESFSLPCGVVLLSGEITLGDGAVITVGSGSDAAFDKITVTRQSATTKSPCIRVKGGSLKLIDSYISGMNCIKLDYSTASRLFVVGGEISSDGDYAVSVDQGSAELCGGTVSNVSGPAIVNRGALSLGGGLSLLADRYEIVTDKPLSLSVAGEYFSSFADVQFDSTFERGSFTEVFYSMSVDDHSISLFDKMGKLCDFSYYAESKYSDERSFGAVFLPYTVTLKGRDGVSEKYTYVTGERPTDLTAQGIEGYVFDGFYLDSAGERRFDIQAPVMSDKEVYAVYKLAPVTFYVRGSEFEYDGVERSLGFTHLYHPLMDDGYFTYQWYRDEVTVSEGTSVTIKNVADSGIYGCRLTFHHSLDSVTVDVKDIPVSVTPRLITVSSPQKVFYNGEWQYAEIPYSPLYTVMQTGGTDVGVYKVTLTLTQKKNYLFRDTLSDSLALDFVIEQGENYFTESPRVFTSYLGGDVRFSAVSRFGQAKLLFSTQRNGEYSPELPSVPGTYFALVSVDETENYKALSSAPIQFDLLYDNVVSLGVTASPTRVEYQAFESFDGQGLVLSAQYRSGRVESVAFTDVKVSYQQGDCFLYRDNGVILSYGGAVMHLPLTVKRTSYNIEDVIFPDLTVVYSGAYHTASLPVDLPVGSDGIPLCAEVTGGGTDKGSYTVTLSFTTESENYLTPPDMIATLTVVPMVTEVIWGERTFVYDGVAKVPTAAFTDALGITRSLAVDGAVSEAGDGYVAVAVPPSQNYSFTNSSVTFSVNKADYDLSGIIWRGEGYVYDGTEKSVYLTGLPKGITVLGYTNAVFTDAGVYTAYAHLGYDERNYNPPPAVFYSWSISKAQYPVAGFEFSDSIFVYDGSEHYPIFSGDMPTGADGVTLEYSFSRGVTHVSDGRVTVTVSFHTASRNYICPDSITRTVEIVPKEISVTWGPLTHTYDSSFFIPVAYSDICPVGVDGGASDAGKYTAVCYSANTDYKILNSTAEFIILKAQNKWLKEPEAVFVYENRLPENSSIPLYGTAIIEIYRDESCNIQENAPLTHGTYYMKYSVPEGRNYMGLVSEIIPLTVKKVVPVSLSVTLKKDTFRAFEVPTKDSIVAWLSYNDGTVEDVTERVSPVYKNGKALVVGDTEIAFFCDGLTVSYSVNVIRAEYDMSRVAWSCLSFEYDGKPKFPTLVGLPDGVTVTSYDGSGGVTAGRYTVSPRLSYDARNFDPPKIADEIYVIEKKLLPLPTLISAEYNGRAHVPTTDTFGYTVVGYGDFISAGEYSVTVALTDTQNYRISGTDDTEVTVSFVISKRPLIASASDCLVYRWWKTPVVDITLSDGAVLTGDGATVVCLLENGVVSFISTDPNYYPVIVGGDVVYTNSLHPRMKSAMLFAALIAVTLLLMLSVAFIKREAITSYILAKRCKKNLTRSQPLLGVVNPYGDMRALPEPLIESKAFSVSADHADSLISDSLAKNLLKKDTGVVYTSGNKKSTVNIDTLSNSFSAYDTVDVNVLKGAGIVSEDTAYVKVLARGEINKPLTVLANDFSFTAVKMIALTGGVARKVSTVTRRKGEKRR